MMRQGTDFATVTCTSCDQTQNNHEYVSLGPEKATCLKCTSVGTLEPGTGGGAGQPQTPWESDIDGAGHSLTDAKSISINVPAPSGGPAVLGLSILENNPNNLFQIQILPLAGTAGIRLLNDQYNTGDVRQLGSNNFPYAGLSNFLSLENPIGVFLGYPRETPGPYSSKVIVNGVEDDGTGASLQVSGGLSVAGDVAFRDNVSLSNPGGAVISSANSVYINAAAGQLNLQQGGNIILQINQFGVTVLGLGLFSVQNLRSTDPGAGSQAFWYDPSDGNRVKYTP